MSTRSRVASVSGIPFFKLFLFFICISDMAAAEYPAFYSLTFSRSVISSGLGEQGTALKDPASAMQFNPANLIYTETGSVSYFVNPLMMDYSHVPLASKSFSMKVSRTVAAGFEYVNWRGGRPFYGDYGPWDYQLYQQSIGGTIAIALGTDWAAGLQVRYAWSSLFEDRTSNNLFFGAGVSYAPRALSQRLTLGLSLMNVGTQVEYLEPEPGRRRGHSGPAPAQFNFAADCAVVKQQYYDISIDFGFSKLLPERDPTTHWGLGYQWKPMLLGGGISYFQELTLGYLTSGTSYDRRAYFTHGARVGLEADGVKAAIGYAGRWHNNYEGASTPLRFPWETFQLTVSTDWNSYENAEPVARGKDGLKGVLLSGGYNFCSAMAQSPEAVFSRDNDGFKNQSLWSMEADFYVSDKTAVTAALGYAHLTRAPRPWLYEWGRLYRRTDRMENLSLESGFRYHFRKSSDPFFAQASLGILLLDQSAGNIDFRYAYKPFAAFGIGWTVPVNGAGLTLMPKLGVRTVVTECDGENQGSLKGFPQLIVGMNVGYML